MLMKMAMKFVEPHLNKIPTWLEAMAKDFEVEECYLMVRSKTDADGNKIPTMVVMGKKDGALIVVKDKEGNNVEYGIESLFGFMSGSTDDDE